MASESVERRLAAILKADAVGYSRLMSQDDEATVHAIKGHRRAIERLVDTFRGRVVDAPGDELLAEFPSAVGSVRCALEIQRTLAAENEKLEPERRMLFRIGIHLGDVMVEESQIYGDGVNVAARLEPLAEPGGICLSDLVYQQVRRRLDLDAADMGEQQLKNIEDAVRVYQIEPESSSAKKTRARAAALKALSPPDKPSLAVLPFMNLSGDPAQEYFNDGLTVDIIQELVRLPGLFLISPDSMFTYKSTNARPREVARELGVRHVLEGTVRKAEKSARITAQLVEGSSGQYLWADRYDPSLEDVFAVQDEITREIVTALDVKLLSGEGGRAVRQHLHDRRALEAYYRGSELMHRFNREDMAEARHLFEEVIRLQPECSFGYADVAWTHYWDVERGWSPAPADSLEKMSELALRAVEVGDISGVAHLMLGHMHLMKHEYDEAIARSNEALEERPSCQGAYSLKANILNYCGRPEEAIPLAQQAIRLSPVAQPWFPEVLATGHYLSGRFEDALAAANQALTLAPDSVDARVVLAASLVETGRMEAAREAGGEILAIDPGFTVKRFADSQPYRDSAALARLLDSLRRAGLEYGGEPRAAQVQELAQPHEPARRRRAPRPRR